MTCLKPVNLTVHLLTMRGYLIQQELLSALRHLACTEDECIVHVAEIEHPIEKLRSGGFEICLRCRRTLEAESTWLVENDARYPNHTTYRTVFDETAPIAEIARAIRRILDTPPLYIGARP